MKYIVIHQADDGKGMVDFTQAIGAYDDQRSAYGAAYLQLCEFANPDGDMISSPFELEGETGFGLSLKHEKYTDYCLVLFCSHDGFGKEET